MDPGYCFGYFDPTDVDLRDLGRHRDFAEGLGVFAHACAHAAHTRWKPKATWPGPVVEAAALLEDLRVEAAHLRRRPLDRPLLRAAPILLDVPFLRRAAPGAARLWQGATAAALCMGRIDNKVLSRSDSGLDAAQAALEKALGTALYERLASLWQRALDAADDDTATMGALGAAWCAALTRPATVIAASAGDRQAALTEAVRLAADVLDAAAIPPPPPVGGSGATSSAPPVTDLFAHTAPPKRSRAATGPERAAATRLAKALADAARTPRTQVAVDAEAPPGRLHMRGALAGAAQRAAGVPVTAKPWKRTVRKRRPEPAARIGIALDVSVSMDVFFTPAATAAWTLARAAKQTGGNAAAATFGERARALIAPGKVPERIPEPMLERATDHLDAVIDALDRALGLGNPDGHARLLFLITDGFLWPRQLDKVAEQCKRLSKAGCAVVQLTPDLRGALEGCRIVHVTDPIASIRVITDATIAELRAAARREH